MRRSGFVTDPLTCDVASSTVPKPAPRETDFEKRRGVSRIEVRRGFAQCHVSQIEQNLMSRRLEALRAVAEAGVSIDFLKLTPSGMSFLVPEDKSSAVEDALRATNLHFSVRKGRSIVLVHAVNMRDEEGLIANIVQLAIGCGTTIDHIGDMHDRMLMVVPTSDADRVGKHIKTSLEAEERLGR